MDPSLRKVRRWELHRSGFKAQLSHWLLDHRQISELPESPFPPLWNRNDHNASLWGLLSGVNVMVPVLFLGMSKELRSCLWVWMWTRKLPEGWAASPSSLCAEHNAIIWHLKTAQCFYSWIHLQLSTLCSFQVSVQWKKELTVTF